jgi:hypothetical protein
MKTWSLAIAIVFCLADLATAQPVASGQDDCDRLQSQDETLKQITVRLPMSSCRIDEGCLSVDWAIAQDQTLSETLALFRFTEKTPLKIHTVNVNRLYYKVDWNRTAQPQNEAFEFVSKMFDQVFPLLGVLREGFVLTGLASGSALSNWIKAVEYADGCLSSTLTRFTDVVVDKTGTVNRERLLKVALLMDKAMPVLSQRRANALENLAADHYDTYFKINERHNKLQARIADFAPRARESVEGVTTVFPPEKRNTVAQLTARAVRLTGEPAGTEVTARYFVATSRPLAYHVGLGYGRLKEIDFKPLKTASGQDLFSALAPAEEATVAAEAEPAGIESVAFLSWEFVSKGPNDRYGLGLTFGTGLNTPGESVYYGATVRIFSRLLITGGLVGARATRGDNMVEESLPGGDRRTLFGAIRDVAETKPFFSISFKVY